MKRKKGVPSALAGTLKIVRLIATVLALVLLLATAREATAKPHIDRTDIYYIPSVLSQEQQIENYIRRVFKEDPDIAVAIAKAESRLNPNAHGDKNNRLAPQGSHGVFQINVAVHKEKLIGRDVNDWKDNIDIAREIYDESGWLPWGVYTNGNYKNYLN